MRPLPISPLGRLTVGERMCAEPGSREAGVLGVAATMGVCDCEGVGGGSRLR